MSRSKNKKWDQNIKAPQQHGPKDLLTTAIEALEKKQRALDSMMKAIKRSADSEVLGE